MESKQHQIPKEYTKRSKFIKKVKKITAHQQIDIADQQIKHELNKFLKTTKND